MAPDAEKGHGDLRSRRDSSTARADAFRGTERGREYSPVSLGMTVLLMHDHRGHAGGACGQ
jgi:hypothetical protein